HRHHHRLQRPGDLRTLPREDRLRREVRVAPQRGREEAPRQRLLHQQDTTLLPDSGLRRRRHRRDPEALKMHLSLLFALAFQTSDLPLPGGGPDGVAMDYLAFDAHTGRVWVPAGNTGSVDVVDGETGKVVRIEGFATQTMERQGSKRVVGPSSATVGDGVVY